MLAFWLAAAQTALMLLGVVTESFASGWAAVSATAGGLTALAGLIGFHDFWTVPVGIAAVVALVIAGVTYRPGSSGGRLVAAGGLAASSAALLYSLQSGQSPVTQRNQLVST